MRVEEALTNVPADERLEELIAGLPRLYATSTDEDYADTMLAHVRAAYGLGYVRGLEERP